ncbi:type II toxin-antitoxin system RelE/ParE family toxin [Endozoicomonas sp. ISHI1]|uniref:type II toxin-antitoxin system RelE/ParE family toxin n=1 Tax=Endozoicomonas sp. ISHI1 TaxID=2825882 RepID=UPI0021488B20|nr:type II toxin-antitoxin system RelE/ParE family toxin [Endozoicomonas sp. ISHI1]
MLKVQKTKQFAKWMTGLKDQRARSAIAARIDRLAFGQSGDAKPVGMGVSELRIHIGKGYRVYYKQQGKYLFILLCGGDKATQQRDIKMAKELVKLIEEQS